MAGKQFYQAAAAEVQAGNVDQALWIKVSADFSNETIVNKQAQYIRLRAAELSQQAVKLGFLRFGPGAWWQWLLYLAATFLAANLVAGLVSLFSRDAESAVFFAAWFLLIIGVVVWGILRYKAHADTYHDPS